MSKEFILGIAGSIRSNFKDIDLLKTQIREATSSEDLAQRIGGDALLDRLNDTGEPGALA